MQSIKKRASGTLLTASVLLSILLFLIFPAHYAEAVREGVRLWAISVLPATLPMLFLMTIFTRRKLFSRLANTLSPLSKALFRVSGAGASAALLSALSGYPIGARTVYDLHAKGTISEEEKLRVAALSTTTGPAFLVGAVGSGMFHSVTIGWILFVSHLIGVYFVCFVLRFTVSPQREIVRFETTTDTLSLSEVLMNSVLSVLCVGGAIALFYAFGQMLTDLSAPLNLPTELQGTLQGLLEMTTGCFALSALPSAHVLAVCTFLATFGGLCVLVQQLSFLSLAHIPAGKFLLIKFIQGTVAALICLGFTLLLGFQL